MSNEIDAKYKEIGNILNKAGPYILTDSVIEILKYSISEDNLDFLLAFKRNISQTMEQLKESIAKFCKNSYSEEEILKKIDQLAKRGVMFDQPNRHGVVVFRLAPIFRQFEYMFMKKLDKTDEFLDLARLFYESEKDLGAIAQNDYDNLPNMVKGMPAQDRTVPIRVNKETGGEIKILVNEELEVPKEQIFTAQDIRSIIDKFDDIAVGQCYCRQKEDFLGHACKQNSPGESCFTLGKSARHTAKHGFSRLVSKEEALKLLKKVEDAGLAHKVYHLNSDISKDEVAICNCCSCCCPTSKASVMYPSVNISNFTVNIDQDSCTGCGTCVEKCFNQVLELNDNGKAEKVEEECVGCGVCSYLCPENAISLIEGPPRRVNIIPEKTRA
ncbi:MAG: 4Fe-4S binding protein [Candidatus Lokiarchaeota archaeon]|nr:4Fe-4S binding protein [Candidatus Lokiarchaeota archaeon]